MITLDESEYHHSLMRTFWDMSEIFFFKRKDASAVEKLFVDYWFGIFPGDAAESGEHLQDLLKTWEIPTDKEGSLSAYDWLWMGTTPYNVAMGYANNGAKTMARWAMFEKYGAFKDGYRGSGNTQGNIIVDVPMPDGSRSETLFSCHTDSVHRTDGFQNITYTHDPSTGYIIQSDNNECLGGDDGTGVWLMTKLIEAGVPGRYIFHRAEEVGGRGSGWIQKSGVELLEGYKRAIAFDRKAKHSIITYQACSRCCSDVFADDLGGQLIASAKQYYLERFQAGDPTVMHDVQAPVTETRTAWRKVPGAKAERTQDPKTKVIKWETPQEQYTYEYTPKNEFWTACVARFSMATPEGEETTPFTSEMMQSTLQQYAIDYPEEMMSLLDDYLEYKDEIWKTDTGGSFTDTANYTDIIPECTNLSVGYYNAHTQSEYQDFAFLDCFIKGLIEVNWEQLHTADPPERGYQSYGYYGYRDTYIAPSQTILNSASKSEREAVRKRQQEQKEARKKERENKRAMMEMFGYYDEEEAIAMFGDPNEEDDWEDAASAVSDFWDDLPSRPSRGGSYQSFYME